MLSSVLSPMATVDLSIGAPTHTISPYLASMSLVYSWAPDAVYGNASRPNSTMVDWARLHRLHTARYPAGEASYWNWEDPSGAMGKSTLDPAFNDADRVPPDEWMSLGEYLDLCEHHSVPSPLFIRRHLRWIFRAELEPDGPADLAARDSWRARLWTFLVRPYLETLWQFREVVRLFRHLEAGGAPTDGAPTFKSVRSGEAVDLLIHNEGEPKALVNSALLDGRSLLMVTAQVLPQA